MDVREGVFWAYRLFLDREPTEAEADQLSAARDAAHLRQIMTSSAQFASLLDRAGRKFQAPPSVDWREGARWAYRLLLNREPSEDEVAEKFVEDDTISSLRMRFVLGDEFELKAADAALLIDFAVVNAFAPFKAPEPIAGSFRDFLGTQTSVDYFPQHLHHLSGWVDNSVPRHNSVTLHGTKEWIGTLRSVLDAGETFVGIELGAGWAPWLVICHRAAQVRGIEDVRLTGVEASEEHFSFMQRHFRANGLDPADFALHRAIVAAEDSVALFPKLHVASEDYGANAVFIPDERAAASNRGELEEVPAIALETLLAPHDRVDLIHIDIQGHEEDVIRSALPSLNRKVRRMVIGTHSRSIEGHLLELLGGQGWTCEYEVPCGLGRDPDGQLSLRVDGEQLWRNSRVPALH